MSVAVDVGRGLGVGLDVGGGDSDADVRGRLGVSVRDEDAVGDGIWRVGVEVQVGESVDVGEPDGDDDTETNDERGDAEVVEDAGVGRACGSRVEGDGGGVVNMSSWNREFAR